MKSVFPGRVTGAASEAMKARIIELSRAGMPDKEIAALVGKSIQRVGQIIIPVLGTRRRGRAPRKPDPLVDRTCTGCGKVEKVSAYNVSKACWDCGHHATATKLRGRQEPNVWVERNCLTCGAIFKLQRSRLRIRRGPDGRVLKYAWGSYCGRECYAVAQRSDYGLSPDRGRGRRRASRSARNPNT